MKDKVYYYNRNGILQLTLNEYPYWTEPRDLFNWSWSFNEQFGHINTFRRAKETYELTIVIDGDYPARHNDLCDIFNADVLANEAGYLMINGWKLPCYITEAEHDIVFDLNRQSTFVVRAINSTWIRENTNSYNGDPSGGSTGEDLGRDYIYWVVPTEEYEDEGSIVEIDNPDSNLEVTALSVSLEPIQDLNGYDKPWSGGNGKNKACLSSANTGTIINSGVSYKFEQDGSVTLNGTASANFFPTLWSPDNKSVLNAVAWSGYENARILTAGNYYWSKTTSGTASTAPPVNLGIYEDASHYINRPAPYAVTLSAESRISHISLYVASGTTFTNYNIKFQLEAGSTATAYEPYSNECPIYGRTEVVTQRTGKNLLPNTATSGTVANVTYTVNDDGTITANGTSSGWQALTVGTVTLPKGDYFASTGINSSSNYIEFSVGGATYNTMGVDRKAFTVTESETITVKLYARPNSVANNLVISPMIYLQSASNDYEPYQGNTYTTALGRTVYGGSLDVVSGELVVDRAIVDLGTLTWNATALGSGNRFYSVLSGVKTPTDTSTMVGLVCSEYAEKKPIDYNRTVQGVTIWTNNTVQIYDTTRSSMTASEFKTAMDGVQLVYPLATPQTYQLTPTQINLITGRNYVWSSVSDIDIKYQTQSVAVPARGYNYGYSTPESHYASIDLAGTNNGFEAIIYGPQVNPTIYLNNQPVKVNVTLEATQRLRIVSNGSIKTIEILEPNGTSTDAFVYRDKENTPFLSLGQHTELTFGQVRFDFTTIERRSQPTWN